MDTDDDLRILIVYNKPDETANGDSDYISEAAVQGEVDIVARTLKDSGYIPSVLPLSNIKNDIPAIIAAKADLVFNLCEGFNGSSEYEMHIAAILEILQIPYTGNRALTLGMARNKSLAKKIFMQEGIPTPRSMTYSEMPAEKHGLSYPLIAKPSCEDASLGITKDSLIKDFAALKKSFSRIMDKYNQPVLVEEFIDGREFNVAILEMENGPVALPPSEIDFTRMPADLPKITGYEAKWLEDDPLYQATPSVCPANLDEKTKEKLQQTALAAFKALGGKDYGRVDFRMNANGEVFVLEYNPNPDISVDAGFAKAVRASGRTYEVFLRTLINNNLKIKERDLCQE